MTLLLKMSTFPCVNLMVGFIVVKIPFAYNAILERPTLEVIWAVCNPYYLNVKFLTANSVEELLGDQFVVRNCYVYMLKVK